MRAVSRKGLSGVVGTVLLMVAGSGGTALISAAAGEPLKGKVVYESEDGQGDSEIFMRRMDGTGRQRLTRHRLLGRAPSFSPDGSKVVYMRAFALYVKKLAGGPARKIQSRYVFGPQWSPDGRSVVFQESQEHEIVVGSIDGSEPNKTLKWGFPRNFRDDDPTWSPSSARVAILAEPDNRKQYVVATVNVSGDEEAEMIPTQIDRSDRVNSLDWSPDGRCFLFTAQEYNPQVTSIMSLSKEGGDPRTLFSVDRYTDMEAKWSPDGSQVVFHMTDPDGVNRLYVMDSDGSDVQLVPGTEPKGEEHPDWYFDTDPSDITHPDCTG